MMEAVRTSETSVDNLFTRQYNPEDSSVLYYNPTSYVGTALAYTVLIIYTGYRFRLAVAVTLV
jgi:hypothetical protein